MRVIGYTANADHVCCDCANVVYTEAQRQGDKPYNDIGETLGVMFTGEESDTPMHCGICGAFIEDGSPDVLHKWASGFCLQDDGILALAERLDAKIADVIESEECGCCGYYHRFGMRGDCRQDDEGFMTHDGDSSDPPATHWDANGDGYYSRAAYRAMRQAEDESC